MKITRGALIVMEGCDRAGKSTQSKLLVQKLRMLGKECSLFRFPDRTTSIGKMLSQFLESKVELEDHAVHLLFTANRWERIQEIRSLLLSGTHVIIDRYSFSGVAYTSAKHGFSLDWCKKPEIGLLQPDLVLYFDLPLKLAQERADFGAERYEQTEFQEKVRENYSKLIDAAYWKMIDAATDRETVLEEVLKISMETIKSLEWNDGKPKPLLQLWNEGQEFV